MKTKILALGVLAAALAAGCEKSSAPPKAEKPKAKAGDHADDGDHGPGPHDGLIVEFGKYHAEFVVDHPKKTATVYVLDEDAKTPVPIAAEKLLLSVKAPKFQVELKADPDAGDPKGKASRFVAAHDNFAKEQALAGTISGEIDGKPYLGDFQEKPHDGHATAAPKDAHGRPVQSADEMREAAIYQKPGGLYTDADIKANGNTTVSAKFKDLKVSHDLKPKPGDRLCPVTLTKANPDLKWVIGGKTYTFCCPPCVEEYVELAKAKPGEIKPPEAFVKK
jgi:YHS domain-containing protein